MSESCDNSQANYFLIGKNKKAETRVEFEKIPIVKEAIVSILKEDKEYWKTQGLKQPGIEKFILLRKVCDKVPINSNVFEAAIWELETEQTVLTFQDGNLTRYVLFGIV